MAHKLHRLSKSILEKPQLMEEDHFRSVAEVLENREEYMSLQKAALALPSEMNDTPHTDPRVGDNVGILMIDGSLTARPQPFAALCGGTDYESLVAQTEAYAKEGKNTLLLKVSSGGGEAFKMFSSANRIKKIASDSNMKVIAFVDNTACSAAYGLTAIADTIVAHPESSAIGNIGVIVALSNANEKLAKEGIKRTFITAGKDKSPFSESGDFKDTFLAKLQSDVDNLYVKFVAHVALNRNISEESVRATEAKSYHAEEALELGLVDSLMEEHEFYEYLAEASASLTGGYSQVTPISLKTKEVNLMSKDITPEASVVVADAELANKLVEMQAAFEAQAAQLAAFESQAAQLEAYKAKELSEKKEALSAKLDSSEYLAECKEGLMSFFMSDISAEQKELMNSVIASADAGIVAQKELASKELAEAKAEADAKVNAAEGKVEEALLASEAARKEFGTAEQTAEEAKPEAVQVDLQARLRANVAKAKQLNSK